LTFITLDSKNWCKGVYVNGKLYTENLPQELDKTWKYASYLKDKEIEYASIYAMGKSLDDLCPENLQKEWNSNSDRLFAFYNSFKQSKISLEENCFYDLVPAQFLLELCEIKTKIVDSIFERLEKPKNYNLLLNTEKIITEISEQPLNLDLDWMKSNLNSHRAITLYNKIKKTNTIKYNLFGSKTGRLTIQSGTFPILNLDKEFRSVIKPNNDAFLELDFNSAELRVLYGLSQQEQPKGDIHELNARRLKMTREEVKKEIFAWLYGSTKIESQKYEKLFNVENALRGCYNGEYVTNCFGRKVQSDSYHKLNYLVQSTAADLFFEQITKISNLLKDRKSKIAFLVHDSLVIDLSREDKHFVNDMIDCYKNTRFGEFSVNISVGKNYGTLRKI